MAKSRSSGAGLKAGGSSQGSPKSYGGGGGPSKSNFESYSSFVKDQIGVDLSKARDTTFSTVNSKFFDIDTNKLSKSENAKLQNLVSKKGYGGYDVSMQDAWGTHYKRFTVKKKNG